MELLLISQGIVVLPSAAYPVGVAPAAGGVRLQNPCARSLDVILDLTAVGGAGTVTTTIDGLDPASGKWYNLLTSAALAANATTVLRVGVGLTAAANLIANLGVPNIVRIVPTVAGNAVTFSVGANLNP